MVAAYASLVRLSNLIIQIRNHPRFSTFFDHIQIQYLAQNVDFLLDFVESYNSHGGATNEQVLDVEQQIASAAYEAENLTENYIEDQSIAGSSEQKRVSYLLALHKLIVDMDFIKEKVMEVKQPTYSMLAAPSRPLTRGNNPTMVGFDDELFQLMDLLTRQPSGRIIIPIVGMGGIGKTTLARNAFQHLLIKQNFDLCLWATISQEYSVRGILVQLLSSMQAEFSCEADDGQLGEQLYKSLYGRRYLIVLDDMWNIDVWNKIKVYCPDNGKTRGRIVITTRLSSVATHCSSSCINMKFLDEDKSWKLLCEKAFGGEECPNPELEEIGKEIVKKCNGLPLSIVVIAGHLRNSSQTKECWMEVANDINSVLDVGEEEQCFSVLTLSYNHLPTHLKPCFLHIGIFWEEDEDINISNLVQIWVAEGFLKQTETQSLEEVAMVYVEDLLDRNLILNNKCDLKRLPAYKFIDLLRVQTFKIHDLLRDLCIRMAEKEKFVSALRFPRQHLQNYSSIFRPLKTHLKDAYVVPDKFGVVNLWTKFKQVCLRYFSCTIYTTASCLYLHSSVFLLWNLQTLIINIHENARIIAPSQIWEMPNLRHLAVRPEICVPDPPPSDHRQDHLILHNLHTLLKVENLRLSEEVCKRIPNIKDLQLRYDGVSSLSSYYCLHNLIFFTQLKSLMCGSAEMSKWRDYGLNLPSSLRNLCLGSLDLDWEDLTIISTMVPHLEDLKLSFCGSNRGQFNGEFPHLKSLTIICEGDFIELNAEKSHYPVLDNLTLVKYRLDEIPSGILEIPTLAKIELLQCSVSAIISTVKAVMEQEEFGEEGFQLLLDFWCAYDEERFWEIVEAEDLTSNNVVVNRSHRTNTTIRMKSRT